LSKKEGGVKNVAHETSAASKPETEIIRDKEEKTGGQISSSRKKGGGRGEKLAPGITSK